VIHSHQRIVLRLSDGVARAALRAMDHSPTTANPQDELLTVCDSRQLVLADVLALLRQSSAARRHTHIATTCRTIAEETPRARQN
jgi:hypothetical protein